MSDTPPSPVPVEPPDGRERFRMLVRKLAPDRMSVAVQWADLLGELYWERHRAYHGVRHIMNLLDRLDALRPVSEGAAYRPHMDRLLEAEIAIWFHDAIYVVGSPHNEERSAALAKSFLVTIGQMEKDPAPPPGLPENVHEAIMATKHDGRQLTGNAARVMVDLDLAGFADDWETFEDNNARIAAEYAAVPPEAYRWGRIKFLAGLLGRPIYNVLTELEAPARANIERHIRDLINADPKGTP